MMEKRPSPSMVVAVVALVFSLVGTVAQKTSASVTIGQLAPDSTVLSACADQWDFVQPTVTSGNSFVVPETGTITSWSTAAAVLPNRSMAMKIFRKVGNPSTNTYQVVGHSGPDPLASGVLNTFPANIPVQPGDVLGVSTPLGGNQPACQFTVSDESYLSRFSPLADGASGDFGPFSTCCRDNVTAVVDPSNTFVLGQLTRNKKKGTATETVTVPNPGDVTASGNGVKQASSSRAKAAVSAPAAGAVELTIGAQGKKKKMLNSTGKVKLSATITYTPTGGSRRSQTLKVKLNKKL